MAGMDQEQHNIRRFISRLCSVSLSGRKKKLLRRLIDITVIAVIWLAVAVAVILIHDTIDTYIYPGLLSSRPSNIFIYFPASFITASYLIYVEDKRKERDKKEDHSESLDKPGSDLK